MVIWLCILHQTGITRDLISLVYECPEVRVLLQVTQMYLFSLRPPAVILVIQYAVTVGSLHGYYKKEQLLTLSGNCCWY